MDFAPDGEQEQVRASAAQFLARHHPVSRLHSAGSRAMTPAELTEVADLGWFGMGIPEVQGGVGFGPVDEMLVFRELGRTVGPLRVLWTCLAAKTAAAAGDLELVSDLVSGRRAVALAVPVGEVSETDGGVSGQVLLLDAADADCAVYVAGPRAVLIGLAGCNPRPRDNLDKSVTMAEAALHQAPVLAGADAPAVEHAGKLGVAAMLVGAAEAMRDMIVEYAKVRVTFGRPIGSYQAVRHPCADMAVRCEAARAQLFMAAMSLDEERSDAAMQLDAAKLVANTAAVRNADSNVQLHGGIAVTDEHDAHLYLKRVHLLRRLFGSDRLIVQRLIDTPAAA